MTVHEFNERLKFGECHDSFWLEVFVKAFGHGTARHLDSDPESQKLGRDWKLTVDGRDIYLDTKLRERDYPDILIEYLSCDSTGAPGWIEKELAIDLVAYGFLPSRTCWLIPWDELRKAWNDNGAEWKRRYRNISADNIGYRTWSVVVPIPVLRSVVSGIKKV